MHDLEANDYPKKNTITGEVVSVPMRHIGVGSRKTPNECLILKPEGMPVREMQKVPTR